jgi:hypothetical protein
MSSSVSCFKALCRQDDQEAAKKTNEQTVRPMCHVLLAWSGCGQCMFGSQRAEWLRQARWAIMTHFLADWKARENSLEMNVGEWNKLVDHFDIEGIAAQLAAVHAG